MSRIKLLVILISFAPSAFAGSCETGNLRFYPKVTNRFLGEPPYGVGFSMDGFDRMQNMRFGEVSFLLLQPADAKFRNRNREVWVEKVKEKLLNGEEGNFFQAASATGAFESTEHIKYLVDEFGSLPAAKIELGKLYRSVSTDYTSPYAPRKWEEQSGVDWDFFPYDQLNGFADTPAGLKALRDDNLPEDYSFLSDILVGKNRVYYLEKNVSFHFYPGLETKFQRFMSCSLFVSIGDKILDVIFILTLVVFPILGIYFIGFLLSKALATKKK